MILRDGGVRRAATGRAKQQSQRGKLAALRQELEGLRIDVSLPAQAPKLTQQLAGQVEVLHRALLTLADTVLEEFGGLRTDVARWRSDRDEWLTSMRSMRQEVNDKLMQVEQEQARALVEVQAAKASLQASVGRSLDQLETRAKALDRQLLETRCDVQLLRNQVVDMQVLTSSDFPTAVVKQRLQDKQAILAQVDEVARDLAPAAIREAVHREVPAVVREQVATVLREAVDHRVEPIQRQVASQVAAAVEGVERLSVDLAQLTGEMQSVQQRCKAAEGSCTALQVRVSGLEAEEQSCPRSLITGLSERLELATLQQARYARSMEEVVRALVDDASQLARQGQAHDTALQQQQHHLSDTREAVVRCAAVFSQVLKVPPPIPLTSLATPLSPLVTHQTINLADHLQPARQPAGVDLERMAASVPQSRSRVAGGTGPGSEIRETPWRPAARGAMADSTAAGASEVSVGGGMVGAAARTASRESAGGGVSVGAAAAFALPFEDDEDEQVWEGAGLLEGEQELRQLLRNMQGLRG